ncbi:hypothetical protein QZH41_012643, partial [Actinostola sp. cb2023]
CNKCFKTFPCKSFGSKPDFSGFNVEDWEKEQVTFTSCMQNPYRWLLKLEEYLLRLPRDLEVSQQTNGKIGFVITQFFALKNILPDEHYNAWLHFVNACRIICRKVISMEDCSKAEMEIVEFCKQYEKLYGPESCTPNMHLSCHLVECIQDYGPVYSSSGVSPLKGTMVSWDLITRIITI